VGLLDQASSEKGSNAIRYKKLMVNLIKSMSKNKKYLDLPGQRSRDQSHGVGEDGFEWDAKHCFQHHPLDEYSRGGHFCSNQNRSTGRLAYCQPV
jgi:hypothetical protein